MQLIIITVTRLPGSKYTVPYFMLLHSCVIILFLHSTFIYQILSFQSFIVLHNSLKFYVFKTRCHHNSNPEHKNHALKVSIFIFYTLSFILSMLPLIIKSVFRIIPTRSYRESYRKLLIKTFIIHQIPTSRSH